MQTDRPWLPSVLVLAMAVLCLSTSSAASTSGSDAQTTPSKQAPAGAAATPEPADPATRSPSIKETLAAVGQISHELKRIDERLGKMEESVAGINGSLAPVGDLARPRVLVSLILLATACVAGLLVLHAALRRWSHSSSK